MWLYTIIYSKNEHQNRTTKSNWAKTLFTCLLKCSTWKAYTLSKHLTWSRNVQHQVRWMCKGCIRISRDIHAPPPPLPAFQPTIFHIVYGLKYKRSERFNCCEMDYSIAIASSGKWFHFAASFIILQTFFDRFYPCQWFIFIRWNLYLCFKFEQLIGKDGIESGIQQSICFFFHLNKWIYFSFYGISFFPGKSFLEDF